MALTTSAAPSWMSQYGSARNKAKSALKKGTPASDIDWAALQTLAERAGVGDLYSQEALIEENYVPTTDPLVAYERQGESLAIGESAGAASTFDDVDDPEVDAVTADPDDPYGLAGFTQEEVDAVDVEDIITRYGFFSGQDMDTTFAALEEGVATGDLTPVQQAVLFDYQQSDEYKQRESEWTADQQEELRRQRELDEGETRGEEGLREDRYNEFVRMLQEDPNRTDINIDAIYGEDSALGDMVNAYLGSSEYLQAQSDADRGDDAVVDDAVVDDAVVDDAVVDDAVVEWDYTANLGQFVADNYAKFKNRIAAGDDITNSVMDLLLSAGASVEVAKANAADAASFIIGRAQTELDAEAEAAKVELEEEDEDEEEEEEVVE